MQTRTTKVLAIVAFIALKAVCVPPVPAAEPATTDLDALFGQLRHYQWGQTNESLALINEAVGRSHTDSKLRMDLEQRLVQVLGSDAPFAARQFACKKLSVMGSERAVPALARLLSDTNLSHSARAALERVGGPSARAALMNALPQSQGVLKAGIIASLGALQATESRNALLALLKQDNLDIASAACSALGQIGTRNTAESMLAFRAKANPALGTDITTAVLQIASRLLLQGNPAQAAALFAGLDSDKEPMSVRAAAFCGLLQAEPGHAGRRISKVFKGNDARLILAAERHLSESKDRTMPAEIRTSAGQFSVAGQLALLNALSARQEPSARPLIVGLMKNKDVRLEAIRALGGCGTAQDIPLLVDSLQQGDNAEKQAASESLARLRAADVNQRLVAALPQAAPELRSDLINVLAKRYATETFDAILRYKQDPGTRVAVVNALGALGGAQQVPALLALYEAKDSDEKLREAVENALWSICNRRKEECLSAIVARIGKADPETHCLLLRTLTAIGTAGALDPMRAALQSDNKNVRATAIQELANWSDPQVIPDLHRLFQTADNDTQRSLTLRGLVGLIPDALDMPETNKLAILKDAMERSPGVAEKRIVLSGLSSLASVPALEYVVSLLDDPSIRVEVQSALVRIARRSRVQDESRTKQLLNQAVEKISDKTVIEQMR